jgi:phosphodiesterase/alkaline phosphatase D-like protein
MANRIRFAFATCQDWPTGYYTAYRDMLRQDLDLIPRPRRGPLARTVAA